MIPRIIHQIWIGPLPPPQKLMNTWRDMHPDWDYIVWRYEYGWKNQNKIDAMHEFNGKSDIMRYEILEEHGGVLVDADSECIKPLNDSFLNHEAFACWENEEAAPGLIATGYVGAVKGSSLMRDCINAIKTASMTEAAWICVGPRLFTRVATTHQELFVYPARTFIPVHHTGALAPGDATIYANQYWGSTHGYDKLT